MFGRNWSAMRRHCWLAAWASFRANAVAHPHGDEGGDDAAAALAGVRQGVAHDRQFVIESAAIMLYLTHLFPDRRLGIAPGEAGGGGYLT